MPAGNPGWTLTNEGRCIHVHSNDEYIDQSPEALRLTLAVGEIDLSGFHVYDKQTLRCDQLTVIARVIGASHIISYSIGNAQLHEVFACVSPPQTPTGWAEISAYSWAGLDQPIERAFSGFEYSFSAYEVPWSDPEPKEVINLLNRCHGQAADYEFGFVQHFPQGECKVTPKTIVVGSYDRKALVIETAHSYPNVRGLVLSRTKLQLTGGVQ